MPINSTLWCIHSKETDYELVVTDGVYVFRDHRFKRAYQLTPQGVQHLSKIVGPNRPPSAWIRAAIDNAYIPHPYEVWDEPTN